MEGTAGGPGYPRKGEAGSAPRRTTRGGPGDYLPVWRKRPAGKAVPPPPRRCHGHPAPHPHPHPHRGGTIPVPEDRQRRRSPRRSLLYVTAAPGRTTPDSYANTTA
ncbi:hypothetical protein Pta02_38360 [Planobispora takensis]|uniref:Uncharacterized protein n=1 Tax=Planobispora takensis TaxID=1367882 RepID=A0A8J3SX43_9ACTN|nr:hypothetical protein Pta02_38360 [Planobispora takensis]